MSSSIMNIVAERIVKSLEAGVVPWRRPFIGSSGMPLRFTGRWNTPYRGINVFTLWACSFKFSTNMWITATQARSIGAKVKKEEFGNYSPVIFFKKVQSRENPTEYFPMMRFYRVYNADQVEGIPRGLIPAVVTPEPWAAIEAGEVILQMLKQRGETPIIKSSSGQAYYSPVDDHIGMPPRDNFFEAEGYYSTLFHEVVHWTGADIRLKRGLSPIIMKEKYGREELIAEMGSAIIGAACGLGPRVIENSASYIESWAKYISDKKNHRHVFDAARSAQAAATYLFGGEWLTECRVCDTPLMRLHERIRGLCGSHLAEEDDWCDAEATIHNEELS